MNNKKMDQDSKLTLTRAQYNLLNSYNQVLYSIKIDSIKNNNKLNDSEKNEKLKILSESFNKIDNKIKSAIKSLYNALLSDNFTLNADFATLDTAKLNIKGSLSLNDTQLIVNNFLAQFLINGKILTPDNRILFLKGVYYLNKESGLFIKYTDKNAFKAAVESYSNIDNRQVVFNGVLFDFEKKQCFKANLKTAKKDDSILIIESESESGLKAA